MDQSKKTKILDISQIRLNPNNPRTIRDEKFKKLCKSLKENPEFLDARPIVVKDNIIIGGNMRYRALLENKTEIKPEWIKDVTGWTDEAIRKFIVVDNIAYGDNDWDILANTYEKEELEDWGMDVDKWGDDEVVEDEVPEVTENPMSKLGEIYQLGRHRIMCGDSTKIEDVERLMDGEKADMVFTDPPYNVDYGVSKNPRHKFRQIENDKQTPEEWEVFCKDLFGIFQAFNMGDIYMWGAPGPEGMKMRLWLTELGCHWSATIIWKKDQLVLTPANYQRMYEPCFYGWFGKSSFNGDRK